MARPTKYKAIYAEQAAKLCALGATNDELADFFKVHRDTIYEWQIVHKKFSDSIRANKTGYDDRIERSLAHRAMGFKAQETKEVSRVVEVVDKKTGEVQNQMMVVESTVTDKEYPPDTKAATIWLANRRRAEWSLTGSSELEEDEAEPQQVVIKVVDARRKSNDKNK